MHQRVCIGESSPSVLRLKAGQGVPLGGTCEGPSLLQLVLLSALQLFIPADSAWLQFCSRHDARDHEWEDSGLQQAG